MYKPEYERITKGRRIKDFRESLGMKQGEFAESLGMKQGSYSDIERGRNDLSPKFIYYLVNNYNINLNWLFTGQGEMIKTPTNTQKSMITITDRINYLNESSLTNKILNDGIKMAISEITNSLNAIPDISGNPHITINGEVKKSGGNVDFVLTNCDDDVLREKIERVLASFE